MTAAMDLSNQKLSAKKIQISVIDIQATIFLMQTSQTKLECFIYLKKQYFDEVHRVTLTAAERK